jgi:hypothetical protein
MRRITLVGLLVLLVGPAAAQQAVDRPSLAAFAEQVGLRDIAGFVETVDSLRTAHRLPARYATKDDATTHGWHGGGLCTLWPGYVIGGDIFHDAGAPLPKASGRSYREADLDSDCRGRGPKRLIFSSDGLLYITVDHYRSLTPVP